MSISVALVEELASLVLRVVRDIENLEDKYNANWDDTSFVFPDWYLALSNAAMQYSASEQHAQYLIDHERDVRVGLPYWWSSDRGGREPASQLLERRFKALVLIELKTDSSQEV